MITNSKIIVSVIGGHTCDNKVESLAIELGKNIAKMGYILVCGGLGGVMQAAAKGAKQANGLTIGILPGNEKQAANPFIDIPIATGIGLARNCLIVTASDVVVALAGEAGTLSEIAFALHLKKPVIGIGTWSIPGVIMKNSVSEAMLEINKRLNV